MSYFNSPYLNTLLKNSIGCSLFWLYLYNNTLAIVWSEALENIGKHLLKYGLTKTGASMIACLISLKYILAYIFHFISWSFFSILVILINISAKLGKNLRPQKLYLSNEWFHFLFTSWLLNLQDCTDSLWINLYTILWNNVPYQFSFLQCKIWFYGV